MARQKSDEESWWGQVFVLAISSSILFVPLHAAAIYLQQKHGYVATIGWVFLIGYVLFRILRKRYRHWFPEYWQIQPDDCLWSTMKYFACVSALALVLSLGLTLMTAVGVIASQTLVFLGLDAILKAILSIRTRLGRSQDRASVTSNGGSIGTLAAMLLCNLILIPVLRITRLIPSELLGPSDLFG